MDLLEQCRLWHEANEYEKIVRALEALDEEQRTPATDLELARAYNNLAQPDEPEGRALLRRALELMRPHEQDCPDAYSWNFRMGYACYFLDREGEALGYLERALELHPGDAPQRNSKKEILELIDDCRRRLTLPRFERPFRRRAGEAWAEFARREADLRRLLDEGGPDAAAQAWQQSAAALDLAFCDLAFSLARRGEWYQLVLSPAGSWARLFELTEFARRAPAAMGFHWDILVGVQPGGEITLSQEGRLLSAGALVQVRRQDGQRAQLTVFCPGLAPADGKQALAALPAVLDGLLGEVARMGAVARLELASEWPEDAVPLEQLPAVMREMGFDLTNEPDVFLENCYVSYRLEPNQDPEADWRLDVIAGSTRCPALVRQYLRGESAAVDQLHGDGAAAGFLCWPLEGFAPGERGEQAFALRQALEQTLVRQAGAPAVALLGGATGLYCGYLDFIAWDLPAVLDAAAAFFADSGLAWASFHSFRRDVGTVRLWNAEEEETPAPVHPETGSLLSPEDIRTMEGWLEGSSGYFYQVLEYLTNFIEEGKKEGRFTDRQARRDLQIALWYAYACLNIDEYEYYYRAAQWMPASEEAAKGCGTWYYRYAAALMYCGRLEEARRYAEQGTVEEPDYPWAWLLAAKLRCYFGEKEAALAAVERGLALAPGDYEFLTLRREIGEGASLEQMEYHWIDPQCDSKLQAGLDKDADDKQRVISCIVLNEEGLAAFWDIFAPDPEDYQPNDPYCTFHRQVGGRRVEVVFLMNEAGLSKLDADWLRTQRDRLDSGRWLAADGPEGEPGRLDTVLLGLDYSVRLLYRGRGRTGGRFQVVLDEAGDAASCEWWGQPPQAQQPETQEEPAPEWVYTQRQMEIIEQHIRTHLGPFDKVFHELVSPDIHVDLCLVPPDGDRDFYTVITMGMGARRMNVPAELAEHKLERAELAIALPADWRLDEEALKDERWYWPLRLLKSLARLPGACDTWLGWGHTVDNQEPYAPDTGLCAAMLVGLQGALPGGDICPMPDGDEINFYQIIPLYRAEMEYKQENGAEALLDHMGGVSFVVHPDRPCAALTEPAAEDFLLDDAAWHLQCIREKQLKVDPLAAYAHLAIYLRWCIAHDLVAENFLTEHGALAEAVRRDGAGTDLRPFVRDALGGRLWSGLFSEEGKAFAAYYYGENEAPSFPSDVDDWSLHWFGPRRYQSEEFQDEAYLFVPFDETYYQGMAAVMDRRFACWKKQGDPVEEGSPEETLKLQQQAACPGIAFPPMEDADPMLAAFGYGRRQAIRDRYIPLLLAVEEGLWQSLSGLALPGELPPAAPLGPAGFACLRSPEGGTRRAVLVRVPAEAPWEVFTRLPFGEDGPRLAAAARAWYEKYGAIPAAVGAGCLELTLPAALPEAEAGARDRLAECLDGRRVVRLG